MSLIERIRANIEAASISRARKAMSDAGRALGAARIAKGRANVASKTEQLRQDVAAGRVARLEWKA